MNKNIIIWIVAAVVVIAIVVAIVLIATNSNDTKNTVKVTKNLYGECKNNFDCGLGFHCELRNHPSKGLCVIPPGGACHSASGDKTKSCYSGHYCDEQDGVCLKLV